MLSGWHNALVAEKVRASDELVRDGKLNLSKPECLWMIRCSQLKSDQGSFEAQMQRQLVEYDGEVYPRRRRWINCGSIDCLERAKKISSWR